MIQLTLRGGMNPRLDSRSGKIISHGTELARAFNVGAQRRPCLNASRSYRPPLIQRGRDGASCQNAPSERPTDPCVRVEIGSSTKPYRFRNPPYLASSRNQRNGWARRAAERRRSKRVDGTSHPKMTVKKWVQMRGGGGEVRLAC